MIKMLTLVCTFLLLLSCNDNNKKIHMSTLWIGEYNVSIDYGMAGDIDSAMIYYDININDQSVIVKGLGYRTYFMDSLQVNEFRDTLYLISPKTFFGDGFIDHSDIDTLGIIVNIDSNFYIKSPIIADKDWNYNVLIKLNKE